MRKLICALWLCWTVPAWGQSQSPENVILKAAAGLPNPGYVISIADEKSWNASKAAVNLGVESETAFTVFATRTIVVREKAVKESTPERLRFIVAHELGHAACRCTSETVANMWAREHL